MNSVNRYFQVCSNVMLATTALSVPLSSLAASIEEVIITATMRAESLQDVPASVTAVSADDLSSIGAYRAQDLNGIVPNVQIKEQSISNSLSVRGVHSAGNQAFEQSVGFFRDGIFIGKAHLSRLPFVDLEQVEVLRGPQGTLFGKNTIAGAVALQTKKPEDEFGMGVNAQIAMDSDADYDVSGYITGPFSETLKGRLVYRYRDSDGWLVNTAEGNRKVPQREEDSIRGSIEWDISESVVMNASYEHSNWDRVGRALQIGSTENSAVYADAVLDDRVLFTNASPTGPFFGSPRASEYSKSDADLGVIKIVAELASGFTLESTTGYAAYTTDEANDGDFGPLTLITNVPQEDYSQFSTELRLLSPGEGQFSYVLGLYYEDNDYEFNEQIDLNVPFTGFTKFATDFDQEHKTLSAFVQADYEISEALSITTALRVSDVEKDAIQSQFIAPIVPIGNTNALDPSDPANAAIFGFYAAALNVIPHTSIDSRSETGIDWSVNLEYDFGDNTGYLTVARGFKAGGFDARRAQPEGNAGPNDTFEFEDEQALTYELGLKSSFLDNSINWNTAFFVTKYTDQQQSIFLGGVTFAVQNAAESTIKGFESELKYQLTDELQLWGNLAYLNFEYDSYPSGPCTVVQQAAFAGAGPCRQDLSGKVAPNAPEWNGAVGFKYSRPVLDGLEFSASGTWTYSDEYFLDSDLDPNILEDSYNKLDLQVGIGSDDGKWYVGILGKNLTDEITAYHRTDVPLNAGTYYALTDQPRTLYLMANYHY